MKAFFGAIVVAYAVVCVSAFHETFDAGWESRWIHSCKYKVAVNIKKMMCTHVLGPFDDHPYLLV